MPDPGTGERVTTMLDFPSRDGLVVNGVRVDYEPGVFSRVHSHPAGAYVYVFDGSVISGSMIANRSCLRRETRSTSRRAPSTPCRAMRPRSSRRACSPSSFSARPSPRPSTMVTDGDRRVLAATRRPDWKAA
jgi:hypothetical protein